MKNRKKSEVGELSPKQSQAVNLIANGVRLKDVASTLRISDRTLHAWRNLPEFARQIREIKEDSYDSALNKLQSACDRAADCLIELCGSAAIPPQTRLKAAELILNFARPSTDNDDLMQAVTAFAKAGVLPVGVADRILQDGQNFVEAVKQSLAEGGLKS